MLYFVTVLDTSIQTQRKEKQLQRNEDLKTHLRPSHLLVGREEKKSDFSITAKNDLKKNDFQLLRTGTIRSTYSLPVSVLSE